ncbi:hypothetical protein [Nonomuraea lactucae]|uniref:hypothetical protein n=1 Tax=Nonomuraea lactucae TaxID=2249762 RepID=UPI001F0695D9|nr:hypothetical protein [Nonomuraea lactucae]
MTRSPATSPPLGAGPSLPVPGATLHQRARCDEIAGRKAYLEAEGRIGVPDGHGAAAAISTEHDDHEVNP